MVTKKTVLSTGITMIEWLPPPIGSGSARHAWLKKKCDHVDCPMPDTETITPLKASVSVTNSVVTETIKHRAPPARIGLSQTL